MVNSDSGIALSEASTVLCDRLFRKRMWHDAYFAVGPLLAMTGRQTKVGLEGTKEVRR